jgi:8-oxo-dGTP pyrophosphatase MutT (NUDIX family)
MTDSFRGYLSTALAAKLPGPDAQYAMAHGFRRPYAQAPADARQAGVMALFYPGEQQMELALIKRASSNPNDRHGGQIGFPGGKFEQKDRNLQDTALRETEEEIGVPSQDIEVLGKLTNLFIPVSHFQVHPYVGIIDYRPTFQPQWEEVEAVLEVPVPHLFEAERRKTTHLKVGNGITLKDVPYFDLRDKIVWGATAMMLNELIQVLSTSAIPEVLYPSK